jgi:hypothetical protein
MGFFLPLLPGEGFWLGFSGAAWKPSALKVAIGNINAVSGGPWRETLQTGPQDYVVCHPQLALDGIHTGVGVLQFGPDLLMTEEGKESKSMTIQVYDPRPGIFPEDQPLAGSRSDVLNHAMKSPLPNALRQENVGKIRQHVIRDPYGVSTWDISDSALATIHFSLPEQFRRITGIDSPPPVPDSDAYIGFRLP